MNRICATTSSGRAFQMMKTAALKDNIKLKVVSSFRDYSTQKRIWNRKYKRFTLEGLSPLEAIEKIVEYSTLPGTSRHHWGTEVDLILGDVEVKGDVLLAENFHGGPTRNCVYGWKKMQLTLIFISSTPLIL